MVISLTINYVIKESTWNLFSGKLKTLSVFIINYSRMSEESQALSFQYVTQTLFRMLLKLVMSDHHLVVENLLINIYSQISLNIGYHKY